MPKRLLTIEVLQCILWLLHCALSIFIQLELVYKMQKCSMIYRAKCTIHNSLFPKKFHMLWIKQAVVIRFWGMLWLIHFILFIDWYMLYKLQRRGWKFKACIYKNITTSAVCRSTAVSSTALNFTPRRPFIFDAISLVDAFWSADQLPIPRSWTKKMK